MRKQQGGRAAMKELLEQTGFPDAATLAAFIEDKKQAETEALSEPERREKAAADKEQAAIARESAAAARERAAQRRTALVPLGATGEDLADAEQLLTLPDDADDADDQALTEAAEALATRRPELFGTPRESAPPAPGGSPAGGPPPRWTPLRPSLARPGWRWPAGAATSPPTDPHCHPTGGTRPDWGPRPNPSFHGRHHQPGECANPLRCSSMGGLAVTLQPIASSRSYTADRAWLASLHGTDQTETITLDISTFTKDTHWVASADPHRPYSRVLSGVPIGKISVSGLYGSYDEAAADARQELAGVTFAEALLAPTATRVPAALLWHGVVKAWAVPGGIDPSTVTPSSTGAQIRFV
ncbi:hypothetical protein [Streptomyces sp. NPDC002845]